MIELADSPKFETPAPSEDLLNRPYVILRGERQNVEGGKWTTEWLLSEYVKCTDGVIGKMDGTIPLKQVEVFVRDESGLKKEKRDLPPPASVVYLDKSARPVAWLVRSLWPLLAREPGTPYEQGKVPQRPREYFLNIDKVEWLHYMGVPTKYIEDAPEELIDIDKVDKEHLTRIRAHFSTEKITEDNLDEAWSHPTRLDGQHVMIVDEVMSSGQTLRIAQRLLTSAIPEAVFSGQFWAKPGRVPLNKGIPDQEGKLQFQREWVPVWYSKDVESGRGVGDRNHEWPEILARTGNSVPEYTKIGRYILSTPPHDPLSYARRGDQAAEELRTDIKKLALELEQHKILYRPSSERPSVTEEEFQAIEERITVINQMDYQTWLKSRQDLEPISRL